MSIGDENERLRDEVEQLQVELNFVCRVHALAGVEHVNLHIALSQTGAACEHVEHLTRDFETFELSNENVPVDKLVK